jgi:hypothetical protein
MEVNVRNLQSSRKKTQRVKFPQLSGGSGRSSYQVYVPMGTPPLSGGEAIIFACLIRKQNGEFF